jgi:hypothetical protein
MTVNTRIVQRSKRHLLTCDAKFNEAKGYLLRHGSHTGGASGIETRNFLVSVLALIMKYAHFLFQSPCRGSRAAIRL